MSNTKRAFRFHTDCPKGRVFVGADAIAAAEKDGWVDTPAKLKEAAKPAPKKKAPAKKKAKKKVAPKKVAASDNSK